MAIRDQNGLTRSQSSLPVGNGVSLSAGLHSASRIQLSDQFPCGDDYAPKVRKPYTITKQRERWTDEEHKKFVEALKLYGRAWRKIEEHVGTKTAVQIRSHAQKFFSKVLRDPNGSSTSTMESIEIPPPRPKRKPMHPYPRKLVELPSKETSNPEHPLRSNSLKSSDFDQENQSPKSVLSAVGSDTLGSADPETPNGSSSPISSVSAVNTSGLVLSEPKAFVEEYGSPSSPGVNASTVLDEQCHMKFEAFPKENVSTKEDTGEPSSRTLKLFGITFSINGTCEPLSLTKGVCDTTPSDIGGGKSFQILPWNSMRMTSSEMKTQRSWSNMPQGAQGTLHPTQLQNGKSKLTKGAGAFIPWCNLPQVKPVVPMEEVERENLDSNIEVEKEVSYTSSSTSTINDEVNGEKSELEAKSCLQSELGGRHKEYIKGFVPYKRCFAERDTHSPIETAEEREEQRIRLSL